MLVTVLGSGSQGNAIHLSDGDASLLVDAGFGFRNMFRRAKSAGIDLRSLSALVLTHEHGDHAKGAGLLAQKLGCPVYASRGTLRALRGKLDGCVTEMLESSGPHHIAGFTVRTARTPHDAREPLALSVTRSGDGQAVAVAYDVGSATPSVLDLLRGASMVIVEANHDENLLRTGPYPPTVQRRIASRAGHLSNEEAALLLSRICHRELETVVLAHLSRSCNQPRLALQVVQHHLDVRGFSGNLLVTSQDHPLGPVPTHTTAVQLELEGLN